jgi:hypothetical protein
MCHGSYGKWQMAARRRRPSAESPLSAGIGHKTQDTRHELLLAVHWWLLATGNANKQS